MITIVYSTHKDQNYNESFKQRLKKSLHFENVQILEYINKNEFSLSQVYNRGISESEFDIVVCIHNDIKLEKGWDYKLVQDFQNNPDYSIIGKAGSCYFPESCVYWEKMSQTMVGQVYHEPTGKKKWLSKYSPKFSFLIPVVTIDGLFISFDKRKIKHQFDETIGKFHFYDHGFCVPNFLEGVKIGVTSSFEITHESIGVPNQEFFTSLDNFKKKYKDVLPLDLKPETIYVPTIKRKPIKNVGKVAIIIPTKSNINLLYDCVKSFYDHCDSSCFDFFIADTGSSDEEKEWIKSNICSLGNVKLIEYDYYNFAKINNDVVRNYTTDDYEFLLFCNNDIKILNDIIYGMLDGFKKNKKLGTVGCRLHFGDNTIQHNGIVVCVNSENRMFLTHKNLNHYYNYTFVDEITLGNTGGLMMIRRSMFNKIGGFNESYIECFEDVELNIKCILLGYENLTLGDCVGYHYESQTRNMSEKKTDNMAYDYNNTLIPFVLQNLNKIKKFITTIK